MDKTAFYTFEKDLENRLKNPLFKKSWEESEPEFLLAKQLIEKRLEKICLNER